MEQSTSTTHSKNKFTEHLLHAREAFLLGTLHISTFESSKLSFNISPIINFILEVRKQAQEVPLLDSGNCEKFFAVQNINLPSCKAYLLL